jgi:hypothetical protein
VSGPGSGGAIVRGWSQELWKVGLLQGWRKASGLCEGRWAVGTALCTSGHRFLGRELWDEAGWVTAGGTFLVWVYYS